MIRRLKKYISNYLCHAIITHTSFERGYGIVPARFILSINRFGKDYLLEIESNFRILKNGKSILVFDDMFLDRCCHELSIEEYQSQREIEKSLLFQNLCNFNSICSHKRINRVSISRCGDIKLFVQHNIELQILNDSHNVDDVIVRLKDCQRSEDYTTKNGTVKKLLSTVFEVRNTNESELLLSWDCN